MLIAMRVMALCQQNNCLQFKTAEQLADYIKCFVSLFLYNSGGHSLYEFLSVLQLKEVQSTFDFMEDFNTLDQRNLFYESNQEAFDRALVDTIQYNTVILAKKAVHQAITGQIHIAAQNGDVKKAAALLLNHGVDPNCETEDGKTPLYIAAQNGDMKMAALLLAYGGDVNIKRPQHQNTNSILVDIIKGCARILQELQDKKLSPDEKITLIELELNKKLEHIQRIIELEKIYRKTYKGPPIEKIDILFSKKFSKEYGDIHAEILDCIRDEIKKLKSEENNWLNFWKSSTYTSRIQLENTISQFNSEHPSKTAVLEKKAQEFK